MVPKEGLIDLDECVLSALTLFSEQKLPKLHLGSYKRPLVVGSGNAEVTGKILFEDSDAVFADEGTYERKTEAAEVDGAVLISASGGKHAPLIAQKLKEKKIETRLLTCNPNALAKDYVDSDKVFVFPTNAEPYTYNTSTYLGMIMSKTGENPLEIKKFIEEKVKKLIPLSLSDYDAVYIIVPAEFDNARGMFLTKFDELFGPMINGRAFTPEQTKHAKTVVPSEKELFISLGYENKIFGLEKNRLNIPLPDNAKHGAAIAVGYYVIGHLQKQKPSYFKDNIENYAKWVSEVFNQQIKPVVEYK